MKPKPLFISYSSQDKDVADHVLSFFESRGLNCWIAPRNIPPAADWAESIIDGIDSASAMVLLLSRYSNESPQVRREVERAVNNGLIIYPLILENIELSKWMQYYISAHQWYDATDVSLNRRLAELISSIRSQQDEQETEPDLSDLPILLENDLATLSTALEVEDNEPERLLPDERRMVAVLNVTADLSDHEVVPSVRRMVSRTVVNLIKRYAKFYGGYFDSRSLNVYRCVFGLEQLLEDDSRRALGCGISLFHALSKVNYTLKSRKLSMDFGLGLASGTIDVNNTGEEDPNPHGEVLQQAQELSEKASNELLATRTIYNAIRDKYSWEEYSEGVYRLSRISFSVPRTRVFSVHTPFVGREKELSSLISLLERQNRSTQKNHLGGSKHLVMGIRGEAGIGKSRLVHEFIEGNCLNDDYLVLRGQTLSFAQPPCWMWTTLLRSILGIEHGSDLNYQEFLDRLKIFNGDDALLNSAPFLAELLSVGSGDNRLENLDSKAIALETKIAFRNLLKVLSKNNKLLVVLEDLHWLEESDRGILEFVTGNCNTELPIVFLLIYRPERVDGTLVQFDIQSAYNIADDMDITEVDEKSSIDLIRQLLASESDSGVKLIDSEAKKFLLDRSRGNPFYLEELVLDLIESGTLVELEKEWRFALSIGEIFVPGTLTGLLQSRLDRLPESWRGVLQHSSVLGVEFQLKLYRKLANKLFLGRAQPEVFEGLERKQMLLSANSAFEKKYVFRHILLHDTAYSSIHGINLKVLHKAAAESIEELLPNERERISGILMHHYEKAGENHKAIQWGFRALKHYTGEEALKLSHRLENLLEEQREYEQYGENVFKLLSSREQVLDILGNRAEQKATIERMIKLAETSDSDYRMAVALKKLGALARVTGNLDQARTNWERALELTRKAGNRAFEGIVLGNLAALHINQGRLDEARANYEKALMIHRDAGDLRSEGIILGNLGILYKNQSRMEEARSHYEKALEIAHKVGDRRSIGDVLGNIGSLLWFQGHLDEAGEYYEKSLAKQQEIGNRRSAGITLTNLGILRMSQGRMDEAQAYYSKALEIARENGDRLIEGNILGNLGVLYAEQGAIDKAIDNYEKALEIHRKVGNRTFEGIVLGNLANSHFKQGRMKMAKEHYEMALEVDREVKNRREEGNVLANLGCLLFEEGNSEEAYYCYQKAFTITSELKLDRETLNGLEDLHDKLLSVDYSNKEISWPDHWMSLGKKTSQSGQNH